MYAVRNPALYVVILITVYWNLYQFTKERNMNLSIKHYGIIFAGLVAAYFHVILFPDIMFTLNGLGYIGLLGAYFLPIPFFQQRHKMVWCGLINQNNKIP